MLARAGGSSDLRGERQGRDVRQLPDSTSTVGCRQPVHRAVHSVQTLLGGGISMSRTWDSRSIVFAAIAVMTVPCTEQSTSPLTTQAKETRAGGAVSEFRKPTSPGWQQQATTPVAANT